jgi:glutathione S-transferase
MTEETILYIGNKRYSSWSLRGWLSCHLAGLAFREVMIPLDQPDTAARIAAISPSKRVPALHHRGRVIWDSLAIAETCAEIEPRLWPRDNAARAHARSITCEMHSGFQALRQAMWFHATRSFRGLGRTSGALTDIARIVAIWDETQQRFGAAGPFLFGDTMMIPDVFYAPVVGRFLAWEPELPESAWRYVRTMRTHPLMDRWYREAAAETAISPKYEIPPA